MKRRAAMPLKQKCRNKNFRGPCPFQRREAMPLEQKCRNKKFRGPCPFQRRAAIFQFKNKR